MFNFAEIVASVIVTVINVVNTIVQTATGGQGNLAETFQSFTDTVNASVGGGRDDHANDGSDRSGRPAGPSAEELRLLEQEHQASAFDKDIDRQRGRDDLQDNDDLEAIGPQRWDDWQPDIAAFLYGDSTPAEFQVAAAGNRVVRSLLPMMRHERPLFDRVLEASSSIEQCLVSLLGLAEEDDVETAEAVQICKQILEFSADDGLRQPNRPWTAEELELMRVGDLPGFGPTHGPKGEPYFMIGVPGFGPNQQGHIPTLESVLISTMGQNQEEYELPFQPPCGDDYNDMTCLNSWERAEYVRQFVELDRQRYSSEEAKVWNELLDEYFPNFDPLNLAQLDPDWDTRIAEDGLPYLSYSRVTFPNLGRLALAQATWGIWDQLGLYQDSEGLEQLAGWINEQEHSVLRGNDPAISYMNEFIHYTYFVTAGGDRETFLAMWSATLFEQRSTQSFTVEGRTHEFLLDILTPASPGFVVEDNLDWAYTGEVDSDFIKSQYSAELLEDLGPQGRILKTFGSTELTSETERCYLRENKDLYVRRFSSDAGDVYIMSQSQWANARNLQVPSDYVCSNP